MNEALFDQLIATQHELECAVQRIGLPAVLKTAAFGYDGKGQAVTVLAPIRGEGRSP